MDGHSVFSVENPLVDIIARVDAAFLAARGKRPGTMHLIDEAESAALVAALEHPQGGSAAPRDRCPGEARPTRCAAWRG